MVMHGHRCLECQVSEIRLSYINMFLECWVQGAPVLVMIGILGLRVEKLVFYP